MINKSLYLALLMLGVLSSYAIDVRAQYQDENTDSSLQEGDDNGTSVNGDADESDRAKTLDGAQSAEDGRIDHRDDESANEEGRSEDEEKKPQEESGSGEQEAAGDELDARDAVSEADASENEPNIAQVEKEEAQAEQLADQANEEEDKSMESLQSALEDIGDNPTPEQAKQLTQAVTTYVESAKKAEIAENARDEAKKRVLSIKIEKGQSSNAPLEPGF